MRVCYRPQVERVKTQHRQRYQSLGHMLNNDNDTDTQRWLVYRQAIVQYLSRCSCRQRQPILLSAWGSGAFSKIDFNGNGQFWGWNHIDGCACIPNYLLNLNAWIDLSLALNPAIIPPTRAQPSIRGVLPRKYMGTLSGPLSYTGLVRRRVKRHEQQANTVMPMMTVWITPRPGSVSCLLQLFGRVPRTAGNPIPSAQGSYGIFPQFQSRWGIAVEPVDAFTVRRWPVSPGIGPSLRIHEASHLSGTGELRIDNNAKHF